ncbi:MAG: TIR domain-containing protein [Saprospiraceae bacterium]|nr:TIR domain-containing protein [Saprospiraceae bacterium]
MSQSAPYTLQFFAAQPDHTIKRSIAEWSGISQQILRAFDKLEKHPVKFSEGSKNIIQILFVKNANLQNKQFYYNLCHTDALRIIKPLLGAKDESLSEKYAPYPIITIGVHDIMSIYEEAPGLDFEPQTANWREQREQNKFLYKLRLDHRVKFLDASIWHRYIALNSLHDPTDEHTPASPDFDHRIEKLLGKIIGYYEQGLYESVAAVTTLEFQCRMLLNSFIDKAGDRGHHEAVTPFKFHSEAVMEGKCERILQFMQQEREGGTRLSDLEWNLLMVDDHSNTPLSSIHLEDETQEQPLEARTELINKKELIEQLLRMGQDASIGGSPAIKIPEYGYTAGGTGIIKKGIEKLKEKSFDIILLDYLIGQSEINPTLKAYGHEFLLEMTTVAENGANLRRGPAGHFWIYPISSFPNAFTDKLRQLNIDGSNRQWFIANGGDPISTPELFRINFYRLILRQITEYYLHEVALERWTGQFIGIGDKDVWCQQVKLQIGIEKQKVDILGNYRDSSIFLKKIDSFLEEQQHYKDFWNLLEEWTDTIAKYEKGQSVSFLLTQLRQHNAKDSAYAAVFRLLEDQAIRFVEDSEAKLIDTASKQKESGKTELIFSHKSLYDFPKHLGTVFPRITKLNLSDNKLVVLPKEIIDLKDLTHLDLENNTQLEKIPAQAILEGKINLRYLQLKNTAIADNLKLGQQAFANTTSNIKNLLEQIIAGGYDSSDTLEEKTHGKKIDVFISYSHKAKDKKDRLVTHLAQLKRDFPGIELWEDGQILPGKEWDDNIKQKLRTADIVLLLIDADFMASTYIHNTEVPAAFERWKEKKCTVIPIYIGPCYMGNSPITQFQGLPGGPNTPISSYVNQEEAWLTVARGICRAIEQLLPKK